VRGIAGPASIGISLLAAGMIAVPAATAHGAQSADTAATLYVNGLAGCSDSGAGTQAVPFCSIQAAADVVNPGQTVDIEGTAHYAPFTVTRSGMPSAPITFIGGVGAAALD
jgi:hypothetical protein